MYICTQELQFFMFLVSQQIMPASYLFSLLQQRVRFFVVASALAVAVVVDSKDCFGSPSRAVEDAPPFRIPVVENPAVEHGFVQFHSLDDSPEYRFRFG